MSFRSRTPGSEPHMPETVEPKEAREPVAKRELYVVDVRPEEEWSENSERIPGAVHIPGDELSDRLDELPDDTRILLVCPDGSESGRIAEEIDDERDIVVLEGGVENWKSSKLITQPSPDAAPPKGEDEPPVESAEDEEDEEDEDDQDGDEDKDEPAEGGETDKEDH